jgi:hypothetical protein
MASLPTSARVTTGRAWLVGGILLLTTVVFGVASQSLLTLTGAGGIIGTALYAAALLVFAYGIQGSGSVTARRPLGTVALTVLAVWLMLGTVVSAILVSAFPNDSPPGALLQFGYRDPFVQFAAALVAVVQIRRVGVVPVPWNWAPTWALAAVSVPWLLMRLITAGATQESAIAPLVVIGAVALDGSAHGRPAGLTVSRSIPDARGASCATARRVDRW